jgi:hypothetical protein
MQFNLTKDTNIIIYGASFIGRQFQQVLKRQGIHVAAYLDRQADKFPVVNGIKVYAPEAAPFQHNELEKYVVIIAVTNPNEHRFIVPYLISLGYRKIIFKQSEGPSDPGQDTIYDKLLSGQLELSKADVLVEYGDTYSEQWRDLSYKRDVDKDHVLAFVPMELLYIGEQLGSESPQELTVSLKGKPLMGAMPLLGAYDFFQGKDEEFFCDYLARNYFKPGDRELWTRWIEEKRDEVRSFDQQNALALDYFEEHPITVQWSGKGYFAVTANYRQAVYLVSKNYKKIPCVITRKDYNTWKNTAMVAPCIDTINKHHLSYVYTPIPHPQFFGFPAVRESYGMSRMMKITKHLFAEGIDVATMKVLDAGSYISYFSRNFYRMGANVTSIEYDAASFELACKLNDLLYCQGINMIHGGIEGLDPSNKYNITLLLTVLYWHLGTDLAYDILHAVDSVTTDILIWESGNEIEREKQWILDNSTFTKYSKLQNTFGSGKMREMGIFRR